MKVKSESEVAQSCLTPSDPMDCSLPGSSAHGIFQARVLEWGAIAFSIAYPKAIRIKKMWYYYRDKQSHQWGENLSSEIQKLFAPGLALQIGGKHRVIN